MQLPVDEHYMWWETRDISRLNCVPAYIFLEFGFASAGRFCARKSWLAVNGDRSLQLTFVEIRVKCSEVDLWAISWMKLSLFHRIVNIKHILSGLQWITSVLQEFWMSYCCWSAEYISSYFFILLHLQRSVVDDIDICTSFSVLV